jgi:hypothetical protein
MTACPVTVIPQKCTGVPITLPEKKNVIFFIDFLGALNFFYNIKMFLKIVGVQSRNKCSLGNVERKEWAGLFV